MRGAIRPGVSPCDCIKYCEKWQSWYCTAPSPEPELTDFHFYFLPQQKGPRGMTLLCWHQASRHHVSPMSVPCQSQSQSLHGLTLALAGPGLSVFTFWHPGCQLCHIVMNLAIIRGWADHQASLTSAARDMLGYGAREPRRISVKIFIIIGHLTNNVHYWISEFSDRKKSHDLKFIRHSARSGRRDSFVLAWKLFILKLMTHH